MYFYCCPWVFGDSGVIEFLYLIVSVWQIFFWFLQLLYYSIYFMSHGVWIRFGGWMIIWLALKHKHNVHHALRFCLVWQIVMSNKMLIKQIELSDKKLSWFQIDLLFFKCCFSKNCGNSSWFQIRAVLLFSDAPLLLYNLQKGRARKTMLQSLAGKSIRERLQAESS